MDTQPMTRLQGLVFRLMARTLILLLMAAAGRSQSTSGGILGDLTDPSGSAVPGAAVTVSNILTGNERIVISDGAGHYAMTNLPPASYLISVEKFGFRRLSRGPLGLTIDQKLRLDFELEVGDIMDAVNVTAGVSLLETETAASGEVIQARQISDLPLLGRDFMDLARLAPGVTAGGGGNNINLAVNGQREFGNSVLIDGFEVSGNRNNDTSLRPSVEAVQEFKVLTSGYAAEFGRASGGVIAVQTKSGSNELHGALYEFLRPQGAAARPFFSSQPPQLKQNNFGASAGGP